MFVRRPVDAVGSGLLLDLDPLQIRGVRQVLRPGRALVDAAVAERGAVDDQAAHGGDAACLVGLDGLLGTILQDWNLLPPAPDRQDLVPDDLWGRVALKYRVVSKKGASWDVVIVKWSAFLPLIGIHLARPAADKYSRKGKSLPFFPLSFVMYR